MDYEILKMENYIFSFLYFIKVCKELAMLCENKIVGKSTEGAGIFLISV